MTRGEQIFIITISTTIIIIIFIAGYLWDAMIRMRRKRVRIWRMTTNANDCTDYLFRPGKEGIWMRRINVKINIFIRSQAGRRKIEIQQQ